MDLTRIKGSKQLTANIGYEGVEVVNDFDSKYPWNEMQIIESENGDKFVRIPKFYVHHIVDEDGYVTGREFSLYKVDNDWVVNNIFIRNGEEIPYIEIGCYLGTVDANNHLRSTSGSYPRRGLKLDVAREYAESCTADYDDNYEYGLYDIWCANLMQDLFYVEFAQTNAADVMKGYIYSNYTGANLINGTTDTIEYVTGTKSETTNNLGSTAMKYRGIEHLYGNGQTVLDHIDCDRGRLTVVIDGQEKVCNATAPTGSGIIKKLKLDTETGLVFPSVLANTGKYIDVYTGADEDNQLFLVGRSNTVGNSLLTYTAYPKADAPRYGVYRLIRRPKTF